MASLPLALSLIPTMANIYQGIQKATAGQAAPSGPSAPPPPPQQTVPLPGLSAPSVLNVPGALPLNSTSTNANQTTAASSANLCELCHLNPKHVDGTKTHPYCSKTCANKAKLLQNGSSTTNTPGNCIHCHVRPKYIDGTRTHDYCSKACAASASKTSSHHQPRKSSVGPPKPAGKGVCQAPGCQAQAYVNNGVVTNYCSHSHKTVVENICLMCRQAEKMLKSHFCSQHCANDAENQSPLLLEVPSGHATFQSVANQFSASWKHHSPCPPVKRVYKIVINKQLLTQYNDYRAQVEQKGQFVAQQRSAGNENRRWHGTRRKCNLGDKGNTQLCNDSGCSLCSIVRNSYDISLWGKKTGWGRFGQGIYTSATSSKSNDYSSNDPNSTSPYKAILLNKVVVGKGFKMKYDNTSLTEPPQNYDSVLAEIGGSLNYDELVVYKNEAIRPSFLVIYKSA